MNPPQTKLARINTAVDRWLHGRIDRHPVAMSLAVLGLVVTLGMTIAALLGVSAVGVVGAVFALTAIVFAIAFGRSIRVARQLAVDSTKAVALHNRGRHADALALLESSAAAARKAKLDDHAMLLEINAAATLLELGEADQAVARAEAVLADSRARTALEAVWGNAVGIWANARLMTASVDLDAVAALLDEHERAIRPEQRPMTLTARTIIDLRRRQWAPAERRLEAQWLDAEAVLPAPVLARLRLLRAYALDELGRHDAADAQRAAAGPEAVARSGPLTRHWPELAGYLQGESAGYRSHARG